MTRYWFDCEFMEDGLVVELLSIGMVCEDGREYYAESRGANWRHANDWVKENVLPHLDLGQFGRGRGQIAGDLLKFVNAGASAPEFWAYYGDYDWVALCQLYGRMVDLPDSWPMFAMDVKQLCVSMGDPALPAQDSPEHNALHDARWTRDAWLWLTGQNSTAEALARYFHETYESLAPEHGWETQPRSRKHWDEVPAENRSLMVAVAKEVLDHWFPARP